MKAIDILGPAGALAEHFPGFVFRSEQIAMAEAVASSLQEGDHCLAEAGTGVGKTFAYLVPALLHLGSNRKVVVSTHTINLQEQLFQKDLPTLRALLPQFRFRFTLLKGMGNYLCLQNMDAAARLELLASEEFQRLHGWAQVTATGDVSELDFSPVGWGEVCASAESCRYQQCSYHDRCFLTQARREAAKADLVVVNHALFFTDLALRRLDPSLSLLPDYEAVIFDEAHHLEDVASRTFGVEFSNYRVMALVARLRHLRQVDIDPAALERLEEANRRLFDILGATGRQEFFLGEAAAGEDPAELEEAARELASRLASLQTLLEGAGRDMGDEMVRARIEGYARTAGRLGGDLLAIFFPGGAPDPDAETPEPKGQRQAGSPDGAEYFSWVEQSETGRRVQCILHLTPVKVAEILRPTLWDVAQTAVLTSATLAAGGTFAYVRERLGVPVAREALVGSPFDYPRQALLYVAAHLDPPSESSVYQQGVIEEIRRILEIAHGRAFVLFTSYRALERAYNQIAPGLTYPCLRQGEASNAYLLEEFRSTPNACLFGVQSFWEGVDVPGEALSCVIIDRLPFAVPDHPIHRARVQSIKDEGGDWFNDFVLPQAQIRLKQGFGRLIRSHVDRGIVCVLDSRLARRRYGHSFLCSLPRCRVTTRIEDLTEFFASGNP